MTTTPKPSAAAPVPSAPSGDVSAPSVVRPGEGPGGEDAMTVQVPPRKPRLVWQGMDHGELVTAVPTQVVEVVRPGRAVEHGDSFGSMDIRKALARNSDELPPNRLIWTNDNIVALRTLLDDRDEGGAYRYRGKVDLIYIDPPFNPMCG